MFGGSPCLISKLSKSFWPLRLACLTSVLISRSRGPSLPRDRALAHRGNSPLTLARLRCGTCVCLCRSGRAYLVHAARVEYYNAVRRPIDMTTCNSSPCSAERGQVRRVSRLRWSILVSAAAASVAAEGDGTNLVSARLGDVEQGYMDRCRNTKHLETINVLSQDNGF